MKKPLIFFLILKTFSLSAQPMPGITIQDDAKVGFINTGSGAHINVTQVFGKSPEYAELKKTLETLEADIQKKVAECANMEKDNLPDKYREGCRNEVIKLNARRDSVQKIEIRFRQDVIRLAETFSNIPINSERLRLAKQFFDEGKIREADQILNAKEMRQEGDALLEKKERELQERQKTDSLLRIKADEFALKARLKATDYTDSLRYDSAEMYFEQSRKYAETIENLSAFAELLYKENQYLRAIAYYERGLKLPSSERDKAAMNMNLGLCYFEIDSINKAEKHGNYSLEIFEKLVKLYPEQYEPDRAQVLMNLGAFYFTKNKVPEAEKAYLNSLKIYEHLVKTNPADYEYSIALVKVNLGNLYRNNQNYNKANIMYRQSIFIFEKYAKIDQRKSEYYLAVTLYELAILYKLKNIKILSVDLFLGAIEKLEQLSKNEPTRFKPALAITRRDLARIFEDLQRKVEAEKMYLLSLEIYKQLAKENPAKFKFDLAVTASDLGNIYRDLQKIVEAEKMHLLSLEIYKQLAKENPAKFKLDLAETASDLGGTYKDLQKIVEAEKMYLLSLEIYEQLEKENPAKFKLDLAITTNDLGDIYRDLQKTVEAEKMYLRSLESYEELALNDSLQFQYFLAASAGKIGDFYIDIQNIPSAKKMYLRSVEIYEKLMKINPLRFDIFFYATASTFGDILTKIGEYSQAQIVYQRALSSFQKQILDKQTDSWMNFILIYIKITDIQDSFILKKEYNEAITFQYQLALCMDSLNYYIPDTIFLKLAAKNYDKLSWYCLLVNRHSEAQTAAERAFTLDPTRNESLTYIGHSYLLRGDWTKAKYIYEGYLKKEPDRTAAKTTLLKDLENLEAAGISYPEMTNARIWLKE